MIGKNIENYKIIDILGEGGMGIVYKAFDLKLERYVAIKILNSSALKNPQFVERFKREAKHQAKLTHPNIVPVYGFTEENNILGIVMESVEGESLERMISRLGRIPLLEALKILKQILIGADYAHEKGFVHRDLKPSNVIINREDVAKIMDFGISKSMRESKGITKVGTKVGTILYMSPEQVKAEEPTVQSDIYSIGITFYEMLSGKTPFDYSSEFEIMEAHLKKAPEKLSSKFPDIPAEVDSLLANALAKTKVKRYPNCKEFLAEVEALIEKLEIKQTKEKKKKVTKEKTKTKDPLRPERIKFFMYAFATILIFSIIVIVILEVVSSFLSKEQTTDSNFYSSNPEFVMKTEWKELPSPTTATLYSVDFANDSIGFACGAEGTLLKTSNGGKSWSATHSIDTTTNLYDVLFRDSVHGFIVGEKGKMFETDNAGRTWIPRQFKVYETLFDIYFITASDTGFIAGNRGTIVRTTDGGYTWSSIFSGTAQLLYAVSFR